MKLSLEYDWTRLWVMHHKGRPANAFGFEPRLRKKMHCKECRESGLALCPHVSHDRAMTVDGARANFEWWVKLCHENETMTFDWKLKKWVLDESLPAEEMARRQEWNRLNRRVVWIKTVDDRDKAVKEVLKYITKSADFSDLKECVEPFQDAVKSARLIQTFGTWYGVKLDTPCDIDHPQDFTKLTCTCGQNIFARMGVFNARDVYFDARSRYRLKRGFDRNSRGTVPRPTIRALEARVNPEEFNYGNNNTDHA
jgi:hypothetical protein